ncbi:hypothetical protein ANCDUO_12776 [Ancylostoma duodenale]|uniref:Uncharacterized protein n=1 Tax=Ancylostoma duodenale TaxID=51022 RepID=A0A0C2GIX7_9BILA|nr:hypothetical protein ANCDUO_12776 [Ancylostoma duodenale]
MVEENQSDIAPTAEKLAETRLKRYGYVLRANKDTFRKVGLDLEVLGKREKGRPEQRWLDTLYDDLKQLVLTRTRCMIERNGVRR